MLVLKFLLTCYGKNLFCSYTRISSYFGIFGRDVQSQTISDAVTPFDEAFDKGGVGPSVALEE